MKIGWVGPGGIGPQMVRRLIHVDAAHQVMSTRPHALAEILWREAQQ